MAGRTRFARYLVADLRDLLERPGALFGLVVSLVGAAFLVVGLLGAVLVGPDNTWTITRTLRPGTPAVIVTTGVVGAIGPEVTVSARRADGQPLFVGRAISSDVTDLTRQTPRLLVIGVRPLHTLVTAPRAGTTSLPQVQTSDIWRDTSAGTGERSLDWRPDAEPQSVLVATTDGAALPALKLSVAWHRGGWFPGALLMVVLGLLLLGAGLHRLSGRRLVGRLLDRVLSPLERVPMPARRAGRRREPDQEVVR
ncbi:MAG: hypothetical protein ACJ71T_04455 [Actinomycetales bacterium]